MPWRSSQYSVVILKPRIMGELLRYIDTQDPLPNVQLKLKTMGIVRQTYMQADHLVCFYMMEVPKGLWE